MFYFVIQQNALTATVIFMTCTCIYEENGKLFFITVFGGFWIDGNDLAQEGVWKYSDGSPMTTTFWNTAQPSNKFGIENCASMRSSYGYLWNDRYCEDDINYICEIV